MPDHEESLNNQSNSKECYFLRFGLIVTGEAEETHLQRLFRSLESSGVCIFRVIRRIGQRAPITSSAKQVRMVGLGQQIPSKDEEEIGLPARRHLQSDDCNFVLLIDDLENERREQAQQVVDRYRLALDTILNKEQLKKRASVHFLVNMLEAYYFGDANAINQALGLEPPINDHSGNVEDIRNPKGQLKTLFQGFNEIEHGGMILERLNVERVLSNPETCAWLRTLFAWCVKALERYPDFEALSLQDKFCLSTGLMSDITKGQLDNL